MQFLEADRNHCDKLLPGLRQQLFDDAALASAPNGNVPHRQKMVLTFARFIWRIALFADAGSTA